MTLLDRTSPATAAPSAAPHDSAPLAAAPGGSYVTTSRTPFERHRTEGAYVTGASAAPVTRGRYVTTAWPALPSGGSYTYRG